jgi:hypothetical protein
MQVKNYKKSAAKSIYYRSVLFYFSERQLLYKNYLWTKQSMKALTWNFNIFQNAFSPALSRF